MKIGIVGFAGSGKTTLFNALTGQSAPTGFSAGKINLGAIKVPDRRVERLAELDNPRKTTFVEITFADVPGSRSESCLDSQTLGRIREMDALVQVVRGFSQDEKKVDPVGELDAFESELILADMQVIEKRMERLEKDRSDPRQLKLLKRCLEKLEQAETLRDLEIEELDKVSLSGYAFLSLKPMLVVLNLPEEAMTAVVPEDLAAAAKKRSLEVMCLSGTIEAEIATLSASDQKDFLADLGIEEPASARFIKSAFAMLDLISFLTHGPDECRAWSIKRGSTALDAAGAVHSDIARGFIRAEVIRFEDLDKLKTEAACKEAGKMRIEGKTYIVEDGDICHFRFNV